MALLGKRRAQIEFNLWSIQLRLLRLSWLRPSLLPDRTTQQPSLPKTSLRQTPSWPTEGWPLTKSTNLPPFRLSQITDHRPTSLPQNYSIGYTIVSTGAQQPPPQLLHSFSVGSVVLTAGRCIYKWPPTQQFEASGRGQQQQKQQQEKLWSRPKWVHLELAPSNNIFRGL